MDKVIEKLSDYDLWGIFFPGFICISIINTLFRIYSGLMISFEFLNNFGNTLAFLSSCYLTGLILQEIGRLTQKIFLFLKGEPEEIFLLENMRILSEEERKEQHDLAKSIFEYDFTILKRTQCKNILLFYSSSLEEKCIPNKIDKYSSLYGLSRSLYIAFCFGILFSIIGFFAINQNGSLLIYSSISCFLLFLLFRNRAYRFSSIRVRYVCRLYKALSFDNNEKIGKGV